MNKQRTYHKYQKTRNSQVFAFLIIHCVQICTKVQQTIFYECGITQYKWRLFFIDYEFHYLFFSWKPIGLSMYIEDKKIASTSWPSISTCAYSKLYHITYYCTLAWVLGLNSCTYFESRKKELSLYVISNILIRSIIYSPGWVDMEYTAQVTYIYIFKLVQCIFVLFFSSYSFARSLTHLWINCTISHVWWHLFR